MKRKKENETKGSRQLFIIHLQRDLCQNVFKYIAFWFPLFFHFGFSIQLSRYNISSPIFKIRFSKNVLEALFTKKENKIVFHQENFGNGDYSSYKSLGKVCAHTMLVVNMQSKCL